MSKSTKNTSDAAYSERLATALFRSLCAYDRWRIAHAGIAQIVNALITTFVAGVLYILIILGWRVVEAVASGEKQICFDIPPKLTVPAGYDYLKLFSSLVAGFFFNRIFLNGILPTFPYAQQSIAMRTLGLTLITHEDFAKIVNDYLPKHDTTKKVRVTCISGTYLFRDCGPLKSFAQEGKLHVVLPAPDISNPTISARFQTFEEQFRIDKNIHSIEHLVTEVEGGAIYLRSYPGNQVAHHQLLCIWRTVLFSSHCIVQAYFPNRRTFAEEKGPVFVFEKRPAGRGAYYEIFDQMFTLLCANSSHLSAARGLMPGSKVS